MPTTFPRASRVLDEAIVGRVFPGAVVEVGRHDHVIATMARGALIYAADAAAVADRTIYDLASLTKVLATTALVQDAVGGGRMRLDDRVGRWVHEWAGADREAVTLQDLLEHCSGLPAHRQYFRTLRGRAAFQSAICAEPLDSPPRTQSTYSDLGFILLGLAIEYAEGAPLDRLFERWRDRVLGPGCELAYLPPAGWLSRIAPTEVGPLGTAAHGTVHDENAAAMGGVAGHAGLFGTAHAVGATARWWLARLIAPQRPEKAEWDARHFARQSTVPGSSRALGWDTMRPTSSCGTRLSPRAIGHTGFTGTSLWIDPEADLYVAFLANRVHPTREGDGMSRVRPALHDAVIEDLAV